MTMKKIIKKLKIIYIKLKNLTMNEVLEIRSLDR